MQKYLQTSAEAHYEKLTMKNSLILFFLIAAFATNAQTAAKKVGDNYEYASPAPKTEADCVKNANITSSTYTDKDGVKYKVYLSDKGKVFIVKPGKSGYRRSYLKID